MKRIGILYQSHLPQATQLSEELERAGQKAGAHVWRQSSWDSGLDKQDMSSTELIVSVGGDGTLLRVARVASRWGVLILGVNVGRMGFLTELEGAEAVDRLPEVLRGAGWVEERTMLFVEKGSYRGYALNEVVVGRNGPVRVVQVAVDVDDQDLGAYRGDGVLIATATGSTGYSLAAGGPILPPTSPYLILKPIAAYPTPHPAILLDPAAVVRLRVRTDHGAVLSLDGQEDTPVGDGEEVIARSSPHRARIVRLRPRDYFYPKLGELFNGTRRHPDLRPSVSETTATAVGGPL
ncbi:MAG: NAD(+)/NADH kinase [Chloroflexi bacterium]|nr:NAD(+)/NADH kinase [Chloroflexota bacterium]